MRCYGARTQGEKQPMKTLNRAQVKELKQNLFIASDDLEHIIQPLTGEMRSAPNIVEKADFWGAVHVAAQRHFWLTASDAAYRDFGIDLPEYAKAAGHPARRLVDAE